MTENSFPPHTKPVAVARQITQELFTEDETNVSILRWWRNGWWQFNGTNWEEISELDVKQPIWETLETATCTTDKGVKDWEPNTARIRGLIEPLQIINRLRDSIDAPAWLDERRGNAGVLISLANGTVNVENGEFAPGHDAALFNTWSLPFDFDNMASCPTWEAFLNEVFNHDPNGMRSLQEYAGYLISGRTDLQKGLLLVGPPGGGKGTISRTLQQLMGLSNCVSPSLSSLGGEFGMEDLIGKPLAVIEDARQEFGARTSTTVERLLSIIGEDAVSVNRKNRSFWNGQLPTRFLMVSNEMPRLQDPSGAILRRFVAIELAESFASKPDTTLGQRINKELPGIFLWALQGLVRLNGQKHFTVPDTQAGALELMSDIGSPTKSYFTDEIDYIITRDVSDIVPVKEVHARYKQWCDETGVFFYSSKQIYPGSESGQSRHSVQEYPRERREKAAPFLRSQAHEPGNGLVPTEARRRKLTMKFLKACSTMFQRVTGHFYVFQTCSKYVPGTQQSSPRTPPQPCDLQEHNTKTSSPVGTQVEHTPKPFELQERLEHVPSQLRARNPTIFKKDSL